MGTEFDQKLDLLDKVSFFDLFDETEKMSSQEKVLAFKPTRPMNPLSKAEARMTPYLYSLKVRFWSRKAFTKK
jgi:hypothetical protein